MSPLLPQTGSVFPMNSAVLFSIPVPEKIVTVSPGTRYTAGKVYTVLRLLSESVQPATEVRLGGHFTFDEIEAEHIRRLVAATSTLETAAKILGVDPATLYRKRKRV